MSVEAEILALSTDWDAALLANDASAVASFMTDDWVYVGPTGATSRADIVGPIATGQLAHHTMQAIGPSRVAVHSDVAILTTRMRSSGTWDGNAYTADEWISEVWVRRRGRWLCALSQKSPAES